MDAKIVLLLTVLALTMSIQAKSRVVFNFLDKLRDATSTTEQPQTEQAQVIRVPNLDCPLGERRDGLGNCRPRL